MSAPVRASTLAPTVDRCRVSVIVPHLNDVAGLKLCLAALQAQSLAPYEIIICDNGSSCGIAELERLFGATAKVLLEPEKGAAAARNAGVRLATGDVLAFLDSDCVPRPDWLLAGTQALQTADLVGGAMRLSFQNPAARTSVEAFEAQFAFPNQRYVEKEHFSVTANLFVRRNTFHDIGSFRAGVPEDKEWGQRAFKRGLRWAFAPDAVIVHPARRTWTDLRAKWRRLSKEAYAYSPHPALFLLRSWIVLAASPATVPTLLTSNRLNGPSERLKVAAVLLRLRIWRLIECHRLVLSKQPKPQA